MSALLVLLAVTLAGGKAQAPQVYRLTFKPDQHDLFLPAPTRSDVVFDIDARRAPAKTRVMFLQPLPAGRHRLRLKVAGGGAGRTFVIATPLQSGRSTVQVDVVGQGRYDFGFWSGSAGAPVKEYRFTVTGPRARTFDLDLP
jgi:hypothetical protein